MDWIKVVVTVCWGDFYSLYKMYFIVCESCGRSDFFEWAAVEHTFCFSFSETQVKFGTVKKQMESMEMEIMETRLLQASELNGEMDNDGDDSGKKKNNHTALEADYDFFLFWLEHSIF